MFELLEISGRIRELCAEGNESRLRRGARDAGMVNLRQQAASLALAGAISVEEAYRFGYFGEES
jgi:type II secretory ATPase GspE/PulE/Tfp pilus assembly ATPase PilB-like protein